MALYNFCVENFNRGEKESKEKKKKETEKILRKKIKSIVRVCVGEGITSHTIWRKLNLREKRKERRKRDEGRKLENIKGRKKERKEKRNWYKNNKRTYDFEEIKIFACGCRAIRFRGNTPEKKNEEKRKRKTEKKRKEKGRERKCQRKKN